MANRKFVVRVAGGLTVAAESSLTAALAHARALCERGYVVWVRHVGEVVSPVARIRLVDSDWEVTNPVDPANTFGLLSYVPWLDQAREILDTHAPRKEAHA